MTPRVLIVDDSLTVRMDLTEAFEDAGFEPSHRASLAEAREALRAEAPDLLVLDLLLPDGSGLDFLVELRSDAATRDLPVIMLSSESEVTSRIEGLAAGAQEYAGKPYDRRYVVARSRELLRRRSEKRRPVGGTGGNGNGQGQGQGQGQGKDESPLVLVIEDSLTYREELRRALEGAGYRVLAAVAGEDGVRTAAEARPDLLVVDGHLPDIPGAEVIRRIRMDPAVASTPCLLLTGSLSRDDELVALSSGTDAFLRKDAGLDVVLVRLAALLNREGRTREEQEAPSIYGPKRILAVDDSETFLQALAGHLRSDGYDVVLARSGTEALSLMAVQSVDAALLDVLMPDLRGEEVCRRIKASPAWRHVPVLMLTAREGREAMVEGINAGADDYIPKSSDFEVVRARLRAQLRRSHVEAENRRIRDHLHRIELEAARERAARELAEARAALLAELERKNVELQRKNEQLEAFAYVASHDLQEPLRTVRMFSDLVERRCADSLDDDGRRYLASITRGAERMQGLIDDLLTCARVNTTALERSAVSLAAVVEQALANLQAAVQQSGARIEAGGLPEVQADATQLLQVLQNLLRNAIIYRREDEPARILVSGGEREGEWFVCVEDNGIGIAPEHRERIFGIFRRLHPRTKYPGNGIGLAVCKDVVERHGGRIWVESEPGRGSRFCFTLAKGNEVPELKAKGETS